MLTQKRVKELLDYCQETGVFRWKVRQSNVMAGTVAGGVDKINGYLRVQIDGRRYKAHRLAFLWMTGKFPTEVDHKDHDRKNNRWLNLRAVSHQENHCNKPLYVNNTSGINGVSWSNRDRKWRSSITANCRTTHLGLFDRLEDAVLARKSAESTYGFHENHGMAKVHLQRTPSCQTERS